MDTLTPHEPAWRFTTTRRARYLDLLGQGYGVMASCRAAGISYETVRRRRDSDPAFAAAERDATDVYVDRLEQAVKLAVLDDPLRSARMTQFILTNLAPNRWKPMTTGPSVQVSATATAVSGVPDIGSLTPDELRAAALAMLDDTLAEHRQLTTPPIGPGGGAIDTTGEPVDPEPIEIHVGGHDAVAE